MRAGRSIQIVGDLLDRMPCGFRNAVGGDRGIARRAAIANQLKPLHIQRSRSAIRARLAILHWQHRVQMRKGRTETRAPDNGIKVLFSSIRPDATR